MSARTQPEIDAEIKALEACLTYAPKRSIFGDDNHREIELQIEVLRDGFDTTSVEFTELSYDDQCNIESALEWKAGNDPVSPSSGWDPFKPEVQS